MNQERGAYGGNKLKDRSLDEVGGKKTEAQGWFEARMWTLNIPERISYQEWFHNDPKPAICHPRMPVMDNHKIPH